MKRRNTHQRQIILDILRQEHVHPTADQLYEEVKKAVPAISKGTVYRNLKILEEMGLINVLKLERNRHQYEYRRVNHSHFHCESCGAIFDIDVRFDAELDSNFISLTGFQVSHHNLEFHGLCQDCQNKQKNKTEEEPN